MGARSYDCFSAFVGSTVGGSNQELGQLLFLSGPCMDMNASETWSIPGLYGGTKIDGVPHLFWASRGFASSFLVLKDPIQILYLVDSSQIIVAVRIMSRETLLIPS